MAASEGAHRFMLRGSPGRQQAYALLRQPGAGTAAIIGGAFERTLDANHAAFSVSTEHTVTAITLQTPNHFADLRVPTAMSPALLCAGSLRELSPTQLLELASIQSFGGVSFVRYDVEGYIGEAVCERLNVYNFGYILNL
eukprot:COSAG05_NODE_7296_length_831_cov_2.027322_2_plen_140_part_00